MKTFSTTLFINRALVMHELRRLRDYAKTIERVLAAEVDREAYSLEESCRYLSMEDRAEVLAENSEYLDALGNHVVVQHRLSIIVAIYAVFEGRLVSQCDMVCHQRNAGYTLRDLSGNSHLDKAKKLLGKFIGIATNEQAWRKMSAFGSLRNLIAHDNGLLRPNSEDSLQKVNSAFPGILEASEPWRLVPSYDAPFTLIAAVEHFYETLFDSLEAWARVRAIE